MAITVNKNATIPGYRLKKDVTIFEETHVVSVLVHFGPGWFWSGSFVPYLVGRVGLIFCQHPALGWDRIRQVGVC